METEQSSGQNRCSGETGVMSPRHHVPDETGEGHATTASEREGCMTITIPRSLLPVGPPTTVTLLNCGEVFGLTPHQFTRLAKGGAFPARRQKGLVIAMYDDVRAYFERMVRVSAPRLRKAVRREAAVTSTERIALANGYRVKKDDND
jgi:hypothetical protein